MRQYLVLKAEEDLRSAYRDFDSLQKKTWDILRSLATDQDQDLINRLKNIKVVAAPSLDFHSTIPGDPDPTNENTSELVVSYLFPDDDLIDDLRKFLLEHLADLSGAISSSSAGDVSVTVKNIGADPVAHVCTLFPAAPARPFGNRSRVREMMGIRDLHTGGLKGHHVNVVIVDQGLNKDAILARHPGGWGGGLAPEGIVPGSAPQTSHGMMIAHNVLDIAPEATIYDVPLIPMHISRPNVFAVTADATYRAVIDRIRVLKQRGRVGSAWIIVNAWGIFDRTGELPEGDYTRNTHYAFEKPTPNMIAWKPGHPLNRIMNTAADEGIDVVFGAGNCGQFTSSGRCGKHDRGEGHSIWGANAHPAVLTVGAVSANADWLGYSSQGPAPWGDAKKPDICTPSHFCEDNDAAKVNSGTSAATGLAAGVIAAIRSNWGPEILSPAELRDAINTSARGQNGVWNNRTGHGILNASALLDTAGSAVRAKAEVAAANRSPQP